MIRNSYSARVKYFSGILLISLLFGSCRTTKYVPQDTYLLEGYEIKGQKKSEVSKEDLENYIRQKPNKTILGLKFHLSLYNLSNIEKEGWFHRSLRTIGEPPVIYDEFLAEKTAGQLELFLRNKGYYNAVVSDTVILKKDKAKVIYRLEPEKAYYISDIKYSIEDKRLREILLPDTVNTVVFRKERYDVDVLGAERKRIEEFLKRRGFFYFSEQFVFFLADSSHSNNKVSLTLLIKKFRVPGEEGGFLEIPHPRFRVSNVYMHTHYNTRLVVNSPESYYSTLDTLSFGNIYLLSGGEEKLNPGVITGSSYIIPGDLYDIQKVQQSYRNLSSLRLFRLVNIEFRETDGESPEGDRLLDCFIYMTPQSLQSYTIEVQGTNSSGNIGAAGNLIYQHRNLLGGAENMNLRLKGAIETLRESYRGNFGNMVELGSELTLNIPKFFLPFRTDQFIRKYNPSTSITAAYNYQRRPDYTRTVANASFGYTWNGNKFTTHMINPVEINMVSIPFKSQDFIDWIDGKYISYSYEPHLVSVSSYSFIYNNQNIQKNRDFIYLRMNLESAGNLLYSAYELADAEKTDNSYRLFNTDFAQYLRGDLDFRYYDILNENNSIVYRLFAGAGLPYNNSTALPFEKKYFAGGANSIRAWQVRNLGPGSYLEEESSAFPNKTADIKLEANLEYRFKLFWVLEGALFVDAGNIWAINKEDEREGALFEFDSFHHDIAVGTGLGTRFVFSFFTFRLDLGIKARDPVLPAGDKWILGNRRLTSDDFTVNIGIGYPF